MNIEKNIVRKYTGILLKPNNNSLKINLIGNMISTTTKTRNKQTNKINSIYDAMVLVALQIGNSPHFLYYNHEIFQRFFEKLV